MDKGAHRITSGICSQRPTILMTMTKTIAEIRNEAAASLSPERQQQWEQF